MWASGSFSFPNHTLRPLSIGDETLETTSVPRIDYKSKRDMIFVHQEKTIRRKGEDAVLVKEVRIHVFRKPLDSSANVADRPSTSAAAPDTTSPPTQDTDNCLAFEFAYTPNASHLFRFSALTFNAHKIHYDPVWSDKVEGHSRGIVVHGPLTALTCIECVQAWLAGHLNAPASPVDSKEHGDDAMTTALQRSDWTLHEFEYRATSPLYADGSPITFRGKVMEHDEEKARMSMLVWAEQDGVVGMKGTALFGRV